MLRRSRAWPLAWLPLCLWLGLLLAWSGPAMALGDDFAPREVRAVMPRDFAPLYSLDKQGEPQGFAVEVLEALARRAGLSVRYLPCNTWDEAILALETGRADLIPNLGITEQRLRTLDFTRPMNTLKLVLFVRASSQDLRNLADFKGRKVGALGSTVAMEKLRQQPGLEVVEFDNGSEGLFQLLAGGIDGLVRPEAVGWAMARKAGLADRLTVLEPPLEEVKRAVALRKGQPELLARLDQALAELQASPEYQAIYTKWHAKPPDFWTTGRVLAIMSLLLVAAMVGMGLWRLASVSRLNLDLLASMGQLRQAQESLRNSQHIQRVFIDASPEPFFRLDRQGVILIANQALARRLGTTTEKLVGAGAFDLLPPEVATRRRGRYMEFQHVPMPDAQGRVTRVAVLGVDVTERRLAERSLRDSEEKLRTLFETMLAGLIMVDERGVIIFANQRMAQMVGCTMEELLGSTYLEHTHDSQTPEAESRMKGLMSGQLEQVTGERLYRRRDGSTFWGLLSGHRLLNPDGSFWALLGVIHDISERKQSEQALSQSEEKFRLAFHTSPDALSITRLEDGRIIDVNEGFEALHGLMREEALGRTTLKLGLWLDPRPWRQLLKYLNREGQVRSQEVKLRGKGGALVSALLSVVVFELGGEQCLLLPSPAT